LQNLHSLSLSLHCICSTRAVHMERDWIYSTHGECICSIHSPCVLYVQSLSMCTVYAVLVAMVMRCELQCVLQCVAVCVAVSPRVPSYVNRQCCSKFQCVAVCCSVLQCVAVCCSALQCLAECYSARPNPSCMFPYR